MLKWYEEKSLPTDIIISSRVRLARNFSDYPFAAKLSDEKAKDLVREITDKFMGKKANEESEYFCCNLSNLSEVDKNAMVERHIVSPLLADKKQETGLILSDDESVSVMINEEDHLRIQSVTTGMDLEKVLKKANEIDDYITGNSHIAFDEKYGYLTSCPTNVGTGLRASYMCYLPGLSVAGLISSLTEELARYGVAIRGIYGEDSKSIGNLYQLSNEKTLGKTESDILEHLNEIMDQVIRQERKRREYLITNNYNELEEQIYRAYGVLSYTKQITSNECMSLLSDIKFGIDQGFINLNKELNIFKLMMDIQPANLQYKMGKSAGNSLRNRYRAEYMNQCFKNALNG
ncbi:protein arginine kinase [Anaeromicropila herbilytica]|uniref:Protein-arginine kinase n=1 Tax=Anaeromicropila herbilytica TaxID=2785025 RepID=A0A7R7EIK8_9FIRM|nr:protein arginine kinase [Anaeromicropila herbilytica]BCN29845.1 protein-arginine kinase [Anaeromicropila herbilytica]